MNSVRTSLALLNDFIRIKAEDTIKKVTQKAYDRRRKQDGLLTRDEKKQLFLRYFDPNISEVRKEEMWHSHEQRTFYGDHSYALYEARLLDKELGRG